jgi:anti-sigma B factor antagonist
VSTDPSKLIVEHLDSGVLKLTGELDYHTVDILADHLNKSPTDEDTTLDLRYLDFVDSTGLRAIVDGHKRHEEQSSKLILGSPQEQFIHLLEITNLIEHLHLERNLAS